MVSIPAPDELADLLKVTESLKGVDAEIDEVSLRRPTLDDAFLAFTGQPAVTTNDDNNAGFWAPNLEESRS
jgi:ABC-2 type transport system ATP-binding protein